MHKFSVAAALALLLGLGHGNAAAQGPGEGVEGDTHEQQQQTDPAAMNRGESDDDRRISQAVRQAIGTDDAARGVLVHTEKGVVTLTGTVPSQEARERLVTAARASSGVKDVRDSLSIGATPDTGARGTPAGPGAGSTSGRGAR
jgi:osmotically-inducible protein OsmY